MISFSKDEYPVLAVQDLLIESLLKDTISILESPPGSGKTTVLPLVLLHSGLTEGKKILMLEPRRIATKNAAKRLSQLHGSVLGETIGYRIRWETKVSQNTQIEIVTEGILTKMLLSDPELKGYGLILFDEFHERNIDTDLGLALIRSCQKLFRPDLKILLMSATIGNFSLHKWGIQNKPIQTQGKVYPVQIEYLGSSGKRIHQRITDVLPTILSKTEGDVLVFLSGKREIFDTESALQFVAIPNIQIHTLYGDLSFAEQEKVFQKAKSGYRKVILATNIAESSLTIPGVRVVLDSGYHKKVSFDAKTGLHRLQKKRISISSATQRAGRAAREAPGNCYRFWSLEEERDFSEADVPDIVQADLSQLLLFCKAWGEDLENLPFLDPPNRSHIWEAKELLTNLQCLDEKGNLTYLGKLCVAVPLPIRLAVLCVKLAELGQKQMGIEIALLFEAQGLFEEVDKDFTKLWENREKILGNLSHAKTMFQKLESLLPAANPTAEKKAIRLSGCMSFAYPDRIGKLREPSDKRYKLANGQGAIWTNEESTPPKWIIVMDGKQGDQDIEIKYWIAISEEEVFTLHPNRILEEAVCILEEKPDPILKCVLQKKWGQIVLSETNLSLEKSQDSLTKLQSFFEKYGYRNFLASKAGGQTFLNRVEILCTYGYIESDFTEEVLASKASEWLLPLFDFQKTNCKLLDCEPLEHLELLLSYSERMLLEKEVPRYWIAPTNSKLLIDYSNPKQPKISVKLQELFGLRETPSIAGGRLKLSLHLLSPGGKPVQVTSDLESFWNHTYFDVKKELKGRYPKHPWPDEPWQALPTKGTKKQNLS
ncbi:ATP-dependent helicase HrpB [Leptospira ryugenii]|uniref:ATP-dependent helicase HrpB n=1 Tax=Leptospira ryugenii TaxID=1917863 RepID=A0A2P2E4K2_9LEPT|nr:ATP-dependent helicase HrpB [Leptospira ryugenii]GBF51815.1 ATP-dependent helicase HrpB [Leptospira ryugenii]